MASVRTLLGTLGHPGTKSLSPGADVLLVRHDIDCGYTYNGVAYSHILDSVADILGDLGKTRCTVASPYSSLIGSKAYGSPVCINREYAWATLASKLKVGGDRIRENIKAKKEVWKKVIKAVSPKAIISVAPGPELCWAARESSIPIYDIQHGVINDGHVLYKEILRDGPEEYVPSGFLCWDQTAAETLNWARGRGMEVYVVGNPWFSRFIQQEDRDVLVQEVLSGEISHSIGRKKILVTLQAGLREFFEEPDYYEFLPESLIQAINRSKEKYSWLLRLHPAQVRNGSKEKVISFMQKSFGKVGAVQWEGPTSQPLPQVMASCDLHITDSSSTTIEAAWYGIPTALLNERYEVGGVLEEYFKLERTLGLATCIRQEPSYILDWISNNGKSESSTWMGSDLRATLVGILKA